jgi:hypothetical protein
VSRLHPVLQPWRWRQHIHPKLHGGKTQKSKHLKNDRRRHLRTYILQGKLVNLSGTIAKLRKATISLVMSVRLSVSSSVRLQGTTRFPLEELSLNLIFECFFFSTICRGNSSFIKIWQEWWVVYVKRYVHLCEYLAQFFLEWKNVSD